MALDLKRAFSSLFAAIATLAILPAPAYAMEQARLHVLTLFRDGDATIVESDGRFGVIDSGEDVDAPDGTDPRYPVRSGVIQHGVGGDAQVIEYMSALGITTDNLDFYIGTHAHSDHIGSADEVIRAFRPKRVYTPHYDDAFVSDPLRLWDNQYVFDNLCAAAREVGAQLITDVDPDSTADGVYAPGVGEWGEPSFMLGSAQIDIMNYDLAHHPRRENAFEDANSYSWGVLVTAGGHSAFISGDIDNRNGDEARLAKALGHVDVLKLGHHGLAGSNSPEYLKALSPAYALQTGYYASLPDDVLDTLDSLGTRYYEADESAADGKASFDVTLSDDGALVSGLNDTSSVHIRWAAARPYEARAYADGLPVAYDGAWTAPNGTTLYFTQSHVGTMADESGFVWASSQDGWRLKSKTGSYYATGWVQVGGAWYYFDPATEIMVTGWRLINSDWYYFDSSGAMRTGWSFVSGSWYYMGASGSMSTGWVEDGGSWYYMGTSGAMSVGWVWDGGNWYYLRDSGLMATGWVWDGGNWYHMGTSGAMETGWLWDGAWYWLDYSNGVMATGVCLADGEEYLFLPSGAMSVGWAFEDGSWYLSDGLGALRSGWAFDSGAWYYLDPSTHAMRTGLVEVGGLSYLLGDSGAMAVGWVQVDGLWCYASSSGALASGWVISNNSWYFMDEESHVMQTGWIQRAGFSYYLDPDSGAMKTGWLDLDGEKYYLSPGTGAMATGDVRIGGKAYTFDENGCLEAPSDA